MNVLKVVNQTKDDKYTYSLMQSGERAYIHINNHNDNENAVIVPIEKLNELLNNNI